METFERPMASAEILGTGKYGIVVLFNYAGDDANMPKTMAVKQSKSREQRESAYLQRLANAGSQHIIRIYKALVKGEGTGFAPDEWDPAPPDEYIDPDDGVV